MYNVYILESERNGRYYIGFTKNVEIRLGQHNSDKVKATRYIRPFKVIYTEQYDTSALARQREQYLKKLKSRQAIQRLIDSTGH